MTLETYQFTIMAIMFVIMAIVSGTVIYRMRGGWPSWPRPLEQMLYCTIFFAVMLMAGVNIIGATVAYALAVLAVLTGHGQYFLDTSKRAIEPERLDFILGWLGFKDDPRTNTIWAEYRAYVDWYKKDPAKKAIFHSEIEPAIATAIEEFGREKLFIRCLSGMALTGGIVSLAPAIALLFINIPVAVLFFITETLSKPLAYYVSHKLGYGTEGGEFGTGGLQWFFAAITGLALMVMA